MATRTITAMFSDQAAAQRAAQALAGELGMDSALVRISPEAGAADTGYDTAKPYEETGFFASLRNMFLPDDDRYAYAEGMRRGRVLVSAQVDDAQAGRASDILEANGAVDLDAQESEWRTGGWSGYDATAHGAARTDATTTAATTTAAGMAGAVSDTGDTIKVVEERLRVGKRVVETGRVRVRSYVVEVPVEEKVVLRDETVHLERRPVDRPATEADLTGLRDKTIEAREVDEVAVVGKEARVVEEIGIRRESADRVETVRDTVRKTEVDVEQIPPAAGSSTNGSVTGSGVAGSTER